MVPMVIMKGLEFEFEYTVMNIVLAYRSVEGISTEG